MRRLIFLLTFPLLLTISVTALATQPPPFRFQYYMHEIFQNYRNMRLAIESDRYDVAKVHLRHMVMNVDDVYQVIPATKADGKTLDKKQVKKDLMTLKKNSRLLQRALEAKNPRKVAEVANDVMNTCAGCHMKARLDFLFRIRGEETLFADYMHQISENYKLAEFYLDSGMSDRAVDYLTVTGHLLSLLTDVLPEESSSGVILDKAGFIKSIRKAEGINELALENISRDKRGNIAPLLQELNDICVACHEPEKIK